MDELMKNDLTSKIYFLEKNEEKRKKMEANALLNKELMVVIKKIFEYYINNKLNERDDLIELRRILNFIVKTGRSKYDLEDKFYRLNGLIDKFGKRK
ncbi:MAG: hypothetical protein PHY80_02155 [Rickettsiales bacterium]|nr:hypothetical protein [Rickettsiales bacterium]